MIFFSHQTFSRNVFLPSPRLLSLRHINQSSTPFLESSSPFESSVIVATNYTTPNKKNDINNAIPLNLYLASEDRNWKLKQIQLFHISYASFIDQKVKKGI